MCPNNLEYFHILCSRLGEDLSRNLLKAHIATGSHLSRICTKKSGLAARLQVSLNRFGLPGILDSHQINQAEKYLVKTYHNNATKETFNELSVKV